MTVPHHGRAGASARIPAVPIALLTLLLVAGCSVVELPTEAQREQFGTMVVTAATYQPEIDLSDMPSGKGEGAAAGAGYGAAKFGIACAAAGPLAPLCLVVMVPLGAGVGAIAGAATTPTPDVESLEQSQREIEAAAAAAQRAALREILAYAQAMSAYPLQAAGVAGPAVPEPKPAPPPSARARQPQQQRGGGARGLKVGVPSRVDYSGLSGQGITSVLEVSVQDIRSQAFSQKNLVRLQVRGIVRVVRVADNRVIYAMPFYEGTTWLRPGDWVLDGGRNLHRELSKAFEDAAHTIVNWVFLLEDNPRATAGDAPMSQPVRPVSRQFAGNTQVQGLQPTLVWEAFDSAANRKKFKERLDGISDVRYELFVVGPGRVTYHKLGLTGTWHTIETPLESCKPYGWNVRAWYVRGGRQRASLFAIAPPQRQTFPQFRTACGVESETVALVERPAGADPFEGMVRIQAGAFEMGGPKGGARRSSAPLHQVVLTRDFYLDATEVTQRAYLRVTGSNPSEDYRPDGPVTRVLWDEARRYCQRLGKRLPTEAEWEYAARAGTATPYSFGTRANAEYGRFCTQCDRVLHQGAVSPYQEPGAVGQKRPNPWGLYDMHGNAAEWVADWYALYEENEQTDPRGPAAGEEKVVRGGSFRGDIDLTTSHARDSEEIGELDKRLEHVGFRCAADAP